MIKHLLLNILLSLVWVALTGHLNYVNFIFGFVMGFFILWILARSGTMQDKGYFFRVPKIIMFIFFFLYEMFKANIYVAKEIITPRYKMSPGILAFEHRLKSDFEITMLVNVIALTPGTMVLKISDDRKFIYIHSLDLKDKEKFIQKLRNGLESKLIEIIR